MTPTPSRLDPCIVREAQAVVALLECQHLRADFVVLRSCEQIGTLLHVQRELLVIGSREVVQIFLGSQQQALFLRLLIQRRATQRNLMTEAEISSTNSCASRLGHSAPELFATACCPSWLC